MKHHLSYLKKLIAQNGPNPEDYNDLDAWLIELAEDIAQPTKLLIENLLFQLGEAASVETMQGFVYCKPHGYAGDYEVIDRIYSRYISEKPSVRKWDLYCQQHPAVEAVRNRKDYFQHILGNRLMTNGFDKLQVLNLASGPCRDLYEFFTNNATAKITFDCVDQDPNAITYATNLCQAHLDKINFIEARAIKFKSPKKYNLIWSAGLFDYFEDKVFVFMLKRLLEMVADDGEIIIGNFSVINPSRAYMSIFQWNLFHRSPQKLVALAMVAGVPESAISISREATGVNLFLHIKKPF